MRGPWAGADVLYPEAGFGFQTMSRALVLLWKWDVLDMMSVPCRTGGPYMKRGACVCIQKG